MSVKDECVSPTKDDRAKGHTQIFLQGLVSKFQMKIVIIAVVAVVLLGGGGAAAFFILGGSEPEVGADGAPVAVAETAPDALYVSLNPAFMVTFKNGSSLRYLQTELSIMSYEQDVIDEIEMNRPAVRNNILMHISSQDYDALESVEGREALRESVRVAVQDSLRTTLPVEAIYFNTFVMQ